MIEVVSENNLHEILPLIREYQEFYKIPEISDSKNRAFFSQFGQSNPAGCQFLFREAEQVCGFATVYFSYASSIASKIAILNDLYTRPEMRGRGIGKQLIEHCHRFVENHGAARLQWVTAPDNQAAQKLYESLDTNKSTWHFYTYNTVSE